MEDKTVTLLYGPNGGVIEVCGVFESHAEAEARAVEYNALEEEEGTGLAGQWSARSWLVLS